MSRADVAKLTPMQRKALRLLWQHRTPAEAAKVANVSINTFHNHLTAARRTLNVGSSLEAARLVALADEPDPSDPVTSDPIAISEPTSSIDQWRRADPVIGSVREASTASWTGFESGSGHLHPKDRNELNITQRMHLIVRHAGTIIAYGSATLVAAYLLQRIARPILHYFNI